MTGIEHLIGITEKCIVSNHFAKKPFWIGLTY